MGNVTYKFNDPNFEKFKSEIIQLIQRINFPNGKKSRYNRFELHIRGDHTDKDEQESFGSSYSRIPQGNYYLKYYYENVPKRAINLYHDKNGKFHATGRFPIFISELDVTNALSNADKDGNVQIKLQTVGQVMRLAIYDRLEAIAYACRKDTKGAKYQLIESACLNILKFREINASNTVNHQIRIASRFVWLPTNVDGQGNLENGGLWTFHPERNKHGSYTDVFDQGIRDLDKIVELFSNINLVLGIASESSGMKGVYVEATPAIYKAKLAYPNKEELDIVDNSYRYHSDILIQEQADGSKISLFDKPQKMFAREKSLNHANLARLVGNDRQVVGDGYSFWRHYSYLNRNPELIGKVDDMSSSTTFNMIVAFVEGDYAPLSVLNPDMKDSDKLSPEEIEQICGRFEDIDKEDLSAMCDTADCHIKISEEIAQQPSVLERSMTFNNHEPAFTKFFHHIKDHMKDVGPLTLTGDELLIHLAYQVKCPTCENMMTPAVHVEGMEQNSYKLLTMAENGHQEWACNACSTFKRFEYMEKYKLDGTGRMYEEDDIMPVSIHSYYNDATSVLCKSVDLETEQESGIALRLNLYTPTDMARIVSPEGVKGFTVPTSQSILGTVSGTIVDPHSGKTITIKDLAVDALVPMGAFKGKNTGQAIAFTRFINAMLGTRYCPDAELDIVTGNMEEFTNKINDIYTSSTLIHTRKVYNSKTGRFEVQSLDNSGEGYPKIRIGIVNLGVTELNTEFFKVLTNKDPMKVSAMNSLAYNAMGLETLDKMLRHNSIENFHNESVNSKLHELICAYKGNADENHKVLQLTDIRTPPSIMFNQKVSKADWTKFISQHQLFTDDDLEDGVCIKFKLDTGEESQIVIPPRATLFSMVRSNYGQQIMLNPAMLKIIEIWKYLSDKTSRVTLDFVIKYRIAINNQLRGKSGLLARGSTYVGEGVQGKEVATGFIPPGKVVVSSNRFWRNIYRTSEHYHAMDYEEFLTRLSLPEGDRGAIQIYGTSQRDPDIWFLQNVNVMEIWHPHRANRHTKHKYNISFFELFPRLKDNNANAIISNTLDVLYLFQSDSDGDLRRIMCIMDTELQKLMKSIHEHIKGYKIFFDKHIGPIHEIYQKVKWWHLSYVLKEVDGNTAREFNPRYEFKTSTITSAESNRAYISAIQAKQSIGLITVSQWIIQQIAAYLNNTKQITYDQYLGVCSFYQTTITQDGCIRSLKHVSGALNVLTIDEIAKNVKIIKSNGVDVTPRDKVLSLIRETGYDESIVQAFTQVIDFWMNHSMVIDKKMKPQMCTNIGLMIKASCAFIYGASGGLLDSQDLYEALNFKDPKGRALIQDMPVYKMHKDIIDLINSIDDKTLPLIKTAAISKKGNNDF